MEIDTEKKQVRCTLVIIIIVKVQNYEWGSGETGQATEARLTDDSGPYVEIMVGAFSDISRITAGLAI